MADPQGNRRLLTRSRRSGPPIPVGCTPRGTVWAFAAKPDWINWRHDHTQQIGNRVLFRPGGGTCRLRRDGVQQHRRRARALSQRHAQPRGHGSGPDRERGLRGARCSSGPQPRRQDQCRRPACGRGRGSGWRRFGSRRTAYRARNQRAAGRRSRRCRRRICRRGVGRLSQRPAKQHLPPLCSTLPERKRV